MQGVDSNRIIWIFILTPIVLILGCYTLSDQSGRQLEPQYETSREEHLEQVQDEPPPTTPTTLHTTSPTTRNTIQLTGFADPSALIEALGGAELARILVDRNGKFSIEVRLRPNNSIPLKLQQSSRNKRAGNGTFAGMD